MPCWIERGRCSSPYLGGRIFLNFQWSRDRGTVGGPSRHGDTATNSNVSVETGGPAMDLALVAVSAVDVMATTIARGSVQVTVSPTLPLDPMGHRKEVAF